MLKVSLWVILISVVLNLTACTRGVKRMETPSPVDPSRKTQSEMPRLADPAGPAAATVDTVVGTIAPTSSMSAPRACHISVLLPDGKVLIAGGMEKDRVYLDSAELYDPATGQFSSTGRMTEKRACPAAIRLPDGNVLVAGGSTTQWLSSAEVYDPVAGTFSPTGEMAARRGGFTATLLPDGKVLVAGGSDGSFHTSAEIYDPTTGEFIPTGSLTVGRAAHTAALLPDGKVLIAGGNSAGGVLDSAEVYDPGTGTFTPTGSMTVPRHKHAAVSLKDGTVLIAGGSDDRDWQGRYASAEIYDPTTGIFSPAGSMSAGRFKLMDAVVLLRSGMPFLAGGVERPEVYDPDRDLFQTVDGRLDAARFYSTATLLPDGRVLIAGGYDASITATSRAWVFEPLNLQ